MKVATIQKIKQWFPAILPLRWNRGWEIIAIIACQKKNFNETKKITYQVVCSTPICLGYITFGALRNIGATREKRASSATLVTACLIVLTDYSN